MVPLDEMVENCYLILQPQTKVIGAEKTLDLALEFLPDESSETRFYLSLLLKNGQHFTLIHVEL